MVEITAASGVNKDNVLKFPAFIRWRDSLLESLALQNKDATHKFHSDPYELKAIEFKGAMLWKNNTAGFVFLNATCKNKAGDSLDGGVFLRGDSVVIMIVVEPADTPGTNQHVIMTVQPRVPAGSLAFTEFPAGMVDDKKKSFAGTAANEIKEETGLEITESELIKMSQIAFNESKKRNTTAPHAWQTFGATRVAANEKLADAFYMSCGGTDESMEAFYVLKRLPRDKFNKLNGTEHGNKEENEKITLRLVPLADVFFECQRDAKSLAALALYQNLKAKGLLK